VHYKKKNMALFGDGRKTTVVFLEAKGIRVKVIVRRLFAVFIMAFIWTDPHFSFKGSAYYLISL